MNCKTLTMLAAGFALTIGSARPADAQGLIAPSPGADLERISRRMADAFRDLSEDVSSGLGQTQFGQHLLRDVQELQQANGAWYAAIRDTNNPYQIRRSYSGIDTSWHRLRSQLASQVGANQAIADEIRRVDEADKQVHQALGLNAYPGGFDGQAAPTGLDEVKRLAYALAQRGEALASLIQADYGPNPVFANLVNDAAQVAQLVDTYYDNLNNPANAQQPDFARQSFAQIIQRSNNLGMTLGTSGVMPPRISSAWDSYTSVHNLIRVNLGLTNQTSDGLPPQNVNVTIGIPINPNPTNQVVQWSVDLDRQVDELLADFTPNVQSVPEGREMLIEMGRLRDHIHEFRRDASQGFDPGRLAFEFREVDTAWLRLSRRFDRVARGRSGPNIQRVQQMGQTCEQIHRVLGMPGFAPVYQGYR